MPLYSLGKNTNVVLTLDDEVAVGFNRFIDAWRQEIGYFANPHRNENTARSDAEHFAEATRQIVHYMLNIDEATYIGPRDLNKKLYLVE